MCIHIFFLILFRVLSGHLLGKKLLIRLTICSFCILTICNFSYFPLGFEGWICALIASVPVLCIPFRILLKITYAYA